MARWTVVSTKTGSSPPPSVGGAIWPWQPLPNYGPDKILVAGYNYQYRGVLETDFLLVRYNAGGSLDTGFNKKGIVQTDVSDDSPLYGDEFNAVLVQDDGKIVAAGNTGRGNFAVARYTSTGKLDPSFDADGIVETSITPNGGHASAVALQQSKILVVGTAYQGPGSAENGDFALVRYNSNGALDPTFGGGDGIVVQDLAEGAEWSHDLAHAVAIDAQGRIVVAGSRAQPGSGYGFQFAISRFTPDGQPDTSFGAGRGFVVTDFGSGGEQALALAIQGDGQIVAAGYWGVGLVFRTDPSQFAVARYNNDGTLDTTFGGTGTVATPILNHAAATSLVIQRVFEGGQEVEKILVSGWADWGDTTSGRVIALARYNPDGSLDPNFGPSGLGGTSVLSSATLV